MEASAGAADLRRLADRDLSRISSYFDASRTLGERQDAAQPVRAAEPGRRVSLPYFDDSERRAGQSLSAAAAGELSQDAFGRAVLSNLNGKDGRPAIPPVVIADLSGGILAAYDYRRRALVVDRTMLLMSVTEDAAPRERAALSETLSSRQALVDHLARHPEAAASFAAKNDALLVHELTHVWQDRRDPVMREMARGNLPQAMLIEYEVEAWTTKNLYIHSRLKRDPAAKIDVFEMDDYLAMLNGYGRWARELRAQYAASSIHAMDVATASAIQQRRIARVRARAASTNDEQTAKSLDLLAMTRADRELSTMRAGQANRLHGLETEVLTVGKESAGILAERYLAAAEAAPNPIEFSVNIRKAEDFAVRAGSKRLLEKIQARKGRSR